MSRYRPLFGLGDSTVHDFEVFLQFCTQAKAMKKSLSEAEIQALSAAITAVPDTLRLKVKSGDSLSALEVCTDKLMKRKAAAYVRSPTLAACAMQREVLAYEHSLFEAGNRQWQQVQLSPALSTLNRALRIRDTDFSRRAMFPTETESRWVIKANVLASYQLAAGESEEVLTAEVFFRSSHSLELAAVRLSAGLAAGYKALGDRFWTAHHDETGAAECYRSASATVPVVANDYLTLAQVKRELLGADLVTSTSPAALVAALSDYYAAIQAKALALKCIELETARGAPSSLRIARLLQSIGEQRAAWKWLVAASHEWGGQLVHKCLGDACEANGNLMRAKLEYDAARKLTGTGSESTEVELKVGAVEAALEIEEPLPTCFSAQVQEYLETRTIRRPAHIASRNLYLCDDMGGEVNSLVQVDCYCHDPHVLMAEAAVAQTRLTDALRHLVTAAEVFEPRASLNSALAWKRAADLSFFHLHDSLLAEDYYAKASESLLVCRNPEGCWVYDGSLEGAEAGSDMQVKVWVGLAMMLEKHGRRFESALWRKKAIRVMRELNIHPSTMSLRGKEWKLYPGNIYVRSARASFQRKDYRSGLSFLLRLCYYSAETHVRTDFSSIINLLWRAFCQVGRYGFAEIAALRTRARTKCNFAFYELRKMYNGMNRARHVMDDSSSEEELFQSRYDSD